jgi:hypothetical protein
LVISHKKYVSRWFHTNLLGASLFFFNI